MKTTITGPRQYSVQEAAEYLQLHSRTVYDLIQAGMIDYRRKGPRKGRLFFLEQDLDAYLSGAAKMKPRS